MEKKNEFTNEELAQAVRWDIIEMIYRAGMGHPGSSLSCVAVSYTHLTLPTNSRV